MTRGERPNRLSKLDQSGLVQSENQLWIQSNICRMACRNDSFFFFFLINTLMNRLQFHNKSRKCSKVIYLGFISSHHENQPFYLHVCICKFCGQKWKIWKQLNNRSCMIECVGLYCLLVHQLVQCFVFQYLNINLFFVIKLLWEAFTDCFVVLILPLVLYYCTQSKNA